MSSVAPNILYRFYDRSDALLYVGITCNPGKRLERHRGEKSWWADVSRISMEHHVDRKALLAAERAAITAEKPAHNVRMNGGVQSQPASAAISRLPKGLETNCAYALGLDDGTCPVGLVIGGDDEGVVITPFDFFIGLFDMEDEWIPAESIRRWRKAELMSPGAARKEGWSGSIKCFQMQPLGDFQTAWNGQRPLHSECAELAGGTPEKPC